MRLLILAASVLGLSLAGCTYSTAPYTPRVCPDTIRIALDTIPKDSATKTFKLCLGR